MKQITLNKVGYAYDTEWILEDLNLTIQQGDGCILLTGKNGAGKSTLLNVVCGFLPPDYGNLSRGGMTIGYLPYEHPLYLISKKCENTVFLITSHTSSGILPVVNRLLALDGHHLVLDTKDHRKIMQYFQPEEDAV